MEFLYHYLWKHRMFGTRLVTVDGRPLEILSPGLHNNDAGPDFFNSRIRCNGEVWAGNVEIHVKASDWFRHHHDTDPKYSSVILHVVGVNDSRVERADGTGIPQVCVSPSREFYDTYLLLSQKIDSPRCLDQLALIPNLNAADWFDTLGIERLQEKAQYMWEMLQSTTGDWRQTIFILIARALGFGLNGLPFELLAKSIPLNYVLRHSDNPLQVEAIVFGQAGMLEPVLLPNDTYYQALCREYRFLQTKYSLSPIPPGLWKYSRTRPGNFPHRRLAILASMICSGVQFLDSFLDLKGDVEALTALFEFEASPYWKEHSNFGVPSSLPLPVKLSVRSIEVVLINVVAPFYFAYARHIGNPELADMGVDLLLKLQPEKNSVTRLWERVLPPARSAFESQARLSLKRNYCEKERCLDCRFGHYLLRKSLKNP